MKPSDEAKAHVARGIRRIALVTPSFSAGCLETIAEIGTENAYFAAGGESFAWIDYLNNSASGMRVIEAVVRRELSGLNLRAVRRTAKTGRRRFARSQRDFDEH